MTPIEYIEFGEKNFPNNDPLISRYEGELILSYVLNINRIDIYTKADFIIPKEIQKEIDHLFERRIKSEPVQYIIGSTQFRNIEIKVDKNVLIPRPETEEMIDVIIEKTKGITKPVCADVGTGSGAIALSIKKEIKSSRVTAIDISDASLKVAKENQVLNHLEGVNFLKGNLLESIENSSIDIIAANLPYVSRGEYDNLDKNVKDYEPRAALTDEKDGLTLINKLIAQSVGKLKHNGWIILEIGYMQGKEVSQRLLNNNFDKVEIIKDFNSLDRFVIGQKPL